MQSIQEIDTAIAEMVRGYKASLPLKQAEIARNIGVERAAVNRVLSGKTRSKYIEAALLRYGVDLAPLHALICLKKYLEVA